MIFKIKYETKGTMEVEADAPGEADKKFRAKLKAFESRTPSSMTSSQVLKNELYIADSEPVKRDLDYLNCKDDCMNNLQCMANGTTKNTSQHNQDEVRNCKSFDQWYVKDYIKPKTESE